MGYSILFVHVGFSDWEALEEPMESNKSRYDEIIYRLKSPEGFHLVAGRVIREFTARSAI